MILLKVFISLPFNLKKFPSTLIGGKHRSFNASWYEKHPWIEYSCAKDAIYSAMHVSSSGSRAFIKVGYRDWKHATGNASMHHNSQTHKQAMVSWKEYKQNVERGTTIENRLDSARMTVINENRHYMTVLMEVILLCAKVYSR